jgi:hypothetical protein
MKSIKLKVSQNVNGLNNEFTQLFDLSNDTFEVSIGTALNRLFEYQQVLKDINDKGAFKCNAPLILEIETERQLISTEDLPEERQQGLKIGNSAKGKRRFANKVYKLLKFIYSEPIETPYSELIAKIELEIAE